MCGIIGYTGYSQARDVLIKGLKTLEYRGYDSAGIALYNDTYKQVLVTKCTGRVAKLEEKASANEGVCGIGHTRWATHGGVCDRNSHPHKFGNVTLVHNGIIENYESIKHQLGVEARLKSDTDSEIAAALIDRYLSVGHSHEEAIVNSVRDIKGTFALAIMFDDLPNVIYAIRNVSPIVCCKNDNGCYIASDIMAIGEYSDKYFVLPEMCIAKIEQSNIQISSLSGNEIKPSVLSLDWDIKSGGKGGFPFFMEKEIREQPRVIEKTIQKGIKDGLPCFDADGVDNKIFEKCESICVVACGTAMHAGLIGKHLIEKICEIPVNVCMASEYMYSEPIINDKTLVICVSQSGETIDTLEALKYAKSKGAMTLSIVNVKGSTIARESENVIYTDAGPEIAVASTKAYTTQVAVFYLITAKLAYLHGKLNYEGVTSFIDELKKVPASVQNILDRSNEIHQLSKSLLTCEHAFMIGRGLDYPTLLEASLKLKEISYIHSEAFASGELKHGTIALITDNTPVIALITQQRLASKQISNIREVESRGANVISFVRSSLDTKAINAAFVLPDLDDEFMAIPSIIAMQLLAYYVSSDKGLDVDKPRNLAKVVTVE
ncbi:MAG: glutamine--fructose-6-phosphate transaminase (isomerizing) [Eubacterium sp.]